MKARENATSSKQKRSLWPSALSKVRLDTDETDNIKRLCLLSATHPEALIDYFQGKRDPNKWPELDSLLLKDTFGNEIPLLLFLATSAASPLTDVEPEGDVWPAWDILKDNPDEAWKGLLDFKKSTETTWRASSAVDVISNALSSSGWPSRPRFFHYVPPPSGDQRLWIRATQFSETGLRRMVWRNILVATLIAAGADPWTRYCAKGAFTGALIQYAIDTDRWSWVRLALDHPSCPSAQDLTSLPVPSSLVGASGNLSQQGTGPRKSTISLLHAATACDQIDVMRQLLHKGVRADIPMIPEGVHEDDLKAGAIPVPSWSRQTPALHVASSKDALDLLCEHGALASWYQEHGEQACHALLDAWWKNRATPMGSLLTARQGRLDVVHCERLKVLLNTLTSHMDRCLGEDRRKSMMARYLIKQRVLSVRKKDAGLAGAAMEPTLEMWDAMLPLSSMRAGLSHEAAPEGDQTWNDTPVTRILAMACDEMNQHAETTPTLLKSASREGFDPRHAFIDGCTDADLAVMAGYGDLLEDNSNHTDLVETNAVAFLDRVLDAAQALAKWRPKDANHAIERVLVRQQATATFARCFLSMYLCTHENDALPHDANPSTGSLWPAMDQDAHWRKTLGPFSRWLPKATMKVADFSIQTTQSPWCEKRTARLMAVALGEVATSPEYQRRIMEGWFEATLASFAAEASCLFWRVPLKSQRSESLGMFTRPTWFGATGSGTSRVWPLVSDHFLSAQSKGRPFKSSRNKDDEVMDYFLDAVVRSAKANPSTPAAAMAWLMSPVATLPRGQQEQLSMLQDLSFRSPWTPSTQQIKSMTKTLEQWSDISERLSEYDISHDHETIKSWRKSIRQSRARCEKWILDRSAKNAEEMFAGLAHKEKVKVRVL